MRPKKQRVIPSRWWCQSKYHKGPRWLPCSYFYRSQRRVSGLQAYCTTCSRISARRENRTDETVRRKIERDREQKATARRAAGIPVRKLKNPSGNYGEGRTNGRSEEWLDGPKAYEWFSSWAVKVAAKHGGNDEWWIHHSIKLTDEDRRYMSHLHNQTIHKMSLQKADEMCNRYDLPLWELEEEAAI